MLILRQKINREMINLTVGRSTQLKEHPGLYKDAERICLIDQRITKPLEPFLNTFNPQLHT